MDLAYHFGRIRDALLRQEQERGGPGFAEWVKRASPHFGRHLVAAYSSPDVHVQYLDWLEAEGLSRRGEIKWHPPMTGPLVFHSPETLEYVVDQCGPVLAELGLVGRSSLGLTPKQVPWSRGKKQVAGKSLTFSKSTVGSEKKE